MSHKHGAYLGGVRSLEDIRLRCYCSDDDECWHFRTARGKPVSKVLCQSIWFNGMSSSVTRVVWQLKTKKPVAADMVVYRVCSAYDCVNPKHLRCGTKQDEFEYRKANGLTRSLKRTIANRTTKRPNQKMTAELLTWLIESTQSGVAAAHGLGIAQSRANCLRVAARKPATVAAASVFSLAASGLLASNDSLREVAA
jgi:hypothetical protein